MIQSNTIQFTACTESRRPWLELRRTPDWRQLPDLCTKYCFTNNNIYPIQPKHDTVVLNNKETEASSCFSFFSPSFKKAS